MDPIVGSAIIGGLSSVAGGLLGGKSQSAANKANLKINRENNAFSERMRDTSIDSQVKQLDRNGINKMMIAPSGAASPQASAAAPMQSVGDYGLGNAASKAMSLASAKAQIANVQSQSAANTANANYLAEQAKTQDSVRATMAAQQVQALSAAGLSHAGIPVQAALKEQAESNAELNRQRTVNLHIDSGLMNAKYPQAELDADTAARRLYQQRNNGFFPNLLDAGYYFHSAMKGH